MIIFFMKNKLKMVKMKYFKNFQKIENFPFFWVLHIVLHIFRTFPAYCPATMHTPLNICRCPFFSHISRFAGICHEIHTRSAKLIHIHNFH